VSGYHTWEYVRQFHKWASGNHTLGFVNGWKTFLAFLYHPWFKESKKVERRYSGKQSSQKKLVLQDSQVIKPTQQLKSLETVRIFFSPKDSPKKDIQQIAN